MLTFVDACINFLGSVATFGVNLLLSNDVVTCSMFFITCYVPYMFGTFLSAEVATVRYSLHSFACV